MRMLIDAEGVARMRYMRSRIGADERHYFACYDRRAIVVVRVHTDGGSTALAALTGSVCEAALGWDRGDAGFALKPNVGKRHSKATLYYKADNTYEMTLSQFLDGAPI